MQRKYYLLQLNHRMTHMVNKFNVSKICVEHYCFYVIKAIIYKYTFVPSTEMSVIRSLSILLVVC